MPRDGRLIVVVSKQMQGEPRFQKGPYYGGSFDFGNNRPHCYAGDIPDGVPMMTNFVRLFADYIRGAAPKDADVTSWK